MSIAKKTIPRQLLLFALASLFMGAYAGFYDPSFNNYLAQVHNISEVTRGALEFPRELPGFLVVFIFTALVFLADTRIAALSALLIGISLWGQGYLAPHLPSVVIWMLIWSTGAHLFMPVSHSIGLRLAQSGQEGRRLGQLGSLESLGSLAGMLVIYLGASNLNLSFARIFGFSGIFALAAAACMFAIKPEKVKKSPRQLILKKRYTLFYILNILFGARKQIFLTFAPWVLIKMFDCGVETFALLGFIATAADLLFRPLLGRAIDRWGERLILILDSLLLILICVFYGFSSLWFPENIALIIIMICFIIDKLLFSVRIARTTYLNSIVENKEDLAPTLSMGITMDHAVAMLIPFGGGLLWANFGYIWVFIAAALIAVLNLLASSFIPSFQSASIDADNADL